jgi:ribosomal protein S6
MRNYEAVIIISHQLSADRQKELTKKVDDVFSKFGAKINARHDRGKKELGYPMKKHKEGHIFIYDLEMDPSKVDALIRELRLEEALLQIMITFPVAPFTNKLKEEATAGGR